MKKSVTATHRRLFQHVRSMRLSIAVIAVLSILTGVFIVMQAHYLAQIVNGVFLGEQGRRQATWHPQGPHTTPHHPVPLHFGFHPAPVPTQVAIPLTILLLVMIARAVFIWVSEVVAQNAACTVKKTLRQRLFAHLLKLGPLYAKGERSGELVQQVYLRLVAPPVVAALVGVGMWFFLGAFGGIFALTYLALFLLSSVGVPLLSYLLGKKVGKDVVKTRAELHTHLVESLQGMADLTAYNQEQQQVEHILFLTTALNVMQMKMARISGMQGALSNLFMNLTSWTMLLVAIPIIHAGRMPGVLLALLVLAAIASFEAVLPLPAAFQQIGSSLEAAKRLFEIVERQPALPSTATPSPRADDDTITMQHVHFRYQEGERDVLSDITFTVPQGRCLAIVGPSGAGKSTLVHLLLRFWDCQRGRVMLGGHDLRCYQPDDLYKMVSVVEQETYLFNTTVRENLLLARPGATDEELVTAAQWAQLHEFVQSLPDGYETQIGEQGLRLSGGERQRIALARAFLKDAPILLLDEPTVHLDAITERAVLQSLRARHRDQTIVMVTHRLAELEMADEILVLQEGCIVERGTHDKLLQSKGHYWRMWQEQQCLAVV